MPGAYPGELVNSQEKTDRFWNRRLGAMLSLIPVVFIFEILGPGNRPQAFIMGAIVFFGTMKIISLTNFCGRIMMYFMGPFDPNEE